MVMGLCSTKMATNIKVNSKMENLKGKVYIITVMEENTMENSKMEKCMGRGK